MRKILQSVARDVTSAYAGTRVEIADGDPTAMIGTADPGAVHQLFLNVILNAAQSAAPNKPVCIHVAAIRDAGGVRILVDDDGPGIAEALRARVLEPFFTTKHTGTGLGLPIARQIALAHGGDLTIGESPAGGCRVTVSLVSPIEAGR
jgi:signal transduction histidine kinase